MVVCLKTITFKTLQNFLRNVVLALKQSALSQVSDQQDTNATGRSINNVAAEQKSEVTTEESDPSHV